MEQLLNLYMASVYNADTSSPLPWPCLADETVSGRGSSVQAVFSHRALPGLRETHKVKILTRDDIIYIGRLRRQRSNVHVGNSKVYFKITQQSDYYLSTFKDITNSIVYFIPVFRRRNLQCNISWKNAQFAFILHPWARRRSNMRLQCWSQDSIFWQHNNNFNLIY